MNQIDRARGYFDPEAETRSVDERTAHLVEKLKGHLAYAVRSAPAVRAVMDESGFDPSSVNDLSDLARLPTLRRDDLKEKQKIDPPFGGYLGEGGEGGEGGEEVYRIYILAGALLVPGPKHFSGRDWAQGLYAAGVRPGDRVINTFNYHYWPIAHMLDSALALIGAASMPLGGGNAGLLVNLMNQVRTEGYIGTPSFLMNIAQRAESMGFKPSEDLGLEVGYVGAEMLPEKMRKRLERKLGVSIGQNYGCAELGCLGFECQAKSGLHVVEDVILEVVNPETGRPVEPGAVGEVVATTFNRLFPLVRLATGDLSAFMTEPCECGRTTMRLKGIMGRTDQATKVKGTFIHPWQLDEMMKTFPEVLAYQVVITRPEELDELMLYVELKASAKPSPVLGGRLEKAIIESFALKGRVEIVERGAIPEWAKKIDDRREWDK